MKSLNLFVELVKTMAHTMEENYEKKGSFFNLECKLWLGMKGKEVVETSLEKVKRKLSSDKMVMARNKRFSSTNRGESQWSMNLGPWERALSLLKHLF